MDNEEYDEEDDILDGAMDINTQLQRFRKQQRREMAANAGMMLDEDEGDSEALSSDDAEDDDFIYGENLRTAGERRAKYNRFAFTEADSEGE